MIAFRPEHVALILSGKKTQTSRTGKKRWNVGAIHLAKTGYRKVDAFAKIRILRVRRESLENISEDDARREGYSSALELKITLKEIYKKQTDDIDIWLVDFEVVEVVSDWRPPENAEDEDPFWR